MGVAKATTKDSRVSQLNGKEARALQTGIVPIFRQASDPVRLSIVLTLAEGERSVGELVATLEQSQSAISHHLALLRHGCIVSPRRQGKQNLYSLTEQGQKIVRAARELGRNDHFQDRKPPRTALFDGTLLKDVGALVDDAESWFRTPNPAFEGRPPIELLGTDDEPRLRNRIAGAKLGMFS